MSHGTRTRSPKSFVHHPSTTVAPIPASSPISPQSMLLMDKLQCQWPAELLKSQQMPLQNRTEMLDLLISHKKGKWFLHNKNGPTSQYIRSCKNFFPSPTLASEYISEDQNVPGRGPCSEHIDSGGERRDILIVSPNTSMPHSSPWPKAQGLMRPWTLTSVLHRELIDNEAGFPPSVRRAARATPISL